MTYLKLILVFVLFFNSLHAQLSNYFSSSVKPRQVELSNKLKEISGLALSPEGKLFAHGDEKGTVYQLDIATGDIIKKFEIGDKKIEEDFEGIAIVEEQFFLVVSNGDIYSFMEGQDNEEVDFTVYKTKLKSKFDVEGLCYDPKTKSLLLACKEFGGKDFKGSRTVYSFDLSKKSLEPKPRFVISLDKLDRKWNVDEFKPSAIERDPKSGNYFILGGKGLVIIELSQSGQIVSEFELDKKYHHQPEGIAIVPNGDLVISDEAEKDKATLTFYRNQKK